MTELPKITCPDIDRLIKSVRNIEKVLRMRVDDMDEAISTINEIQYEISGFEDSLEQLRDANRSLREVAERAEGLEEEVETLAEELDNLTKEKL